MSDYVCSKCLFIEECGSSDVGWCPIKKEYRKVNEYPCAKWKHGKENKNED